MSKAHSHIRPNTYLFLRLPSDTLKLLEITPNTIIDVGKLGSFPSNLLLGRPYYYTYEILDKKENESHSQLRVVPASELNAEIAASDATPSESRGDPATPPANGISDVYDLVGEDGTVIMKNNRLTVDDASRQALSQQEIEELKKSSGGKEIIEKICANHSALDEKTDFAKAKYTLRKTKKYLKRFTALPMDIGILIDYVMVKEAPRIMEMRQETLGLIMAWSHAHYSGDEVVGRSADGKRVGGGRWLVLDDTGGLVVAAMAERMNILFDQNDGSTSRANGTALPTSTTQQPDNTTDQHHNGTSHKHSDFPLPSATNALTLLHPAVQPNLSLLKYFGYDTNSPSPSHPLHTHLKSLSWLQLLHPDDDITYSEPETVSDGTLKTWKSGKRGAYWKKRRRWERCKNIVDEAREGGFDGLVVASNMDPGSVMPHLVPLVRGGGHVVVYSPTVEPLVNIMDLYSKERRGACISLLSRGVVPDAEDFPVDPRLILAPNLQTSRVTEWQVLPGRTHPLMTSRGGAEGYVFTGRRVIPLEGGVEARGNFGGRKRKVEDVGDGE